MIVNVPSKRFKKGVKELATKLGFVVPTGAQVSQKCQTSTSKT